MDRSNGGITSGDDIAESEGLIKQDTTMKRMQCGPMIVQIHRPSSQPDQSTSRSSLDSDLPRNSSRPGLLTNFWLWPSTDLKRVMEVFSLHLRWK